MNEFQSCNAHNDNSGSSLLSCLCCNISDFREKLFKNSYEAKNNAPWDIYIASLGIKPLISKALTLIRKFPYGEDGTYN